MKTILKRCTKCGHVAKVRPRVRRCYQRAFGKGSYACYGVLEPVVKPTPHALKPAPGLGVGSLLGEEGVAAAVAERGKTVRAKAQAELDRTRKRIGDHTRTLTATVAYINKYAKLITKLEGRATRLARRASMTDGELEAERQKAIATLRKRSKATRHIEVEE